MNNEKNTTNMPLLSVSHLKKHFPIRGKSLTAETEYVKAVDDISFVVNKNETLGLVGESGCGKTTLIRSIMLLEKPTSGTLTFEDKDLLNLNPKDLRHLRRDFQIVFQDPYSALDPRMTIGEIIAEPLVVHKIGTKEEREEQVKELLKMVGLETSYYGRHAHEFSGGQRQRICIARALALKPKLILCDEPVSALDVSIQAQILNLLKNLQEEFDLTYIFISHALNVVRHVSDKVGVMYLGKLVELASVDQLYDNPQHPYTKALLSAIPIPDPEATKERILLTGDIPSPQNPPSGCNFHTRCPFVKDICKTQEPEFKERSTGCYVACHF